MAQRRYPRNKINVMTEVQTCAARLVLGAVSMQQQSKDQDQNEDESYQRHNQQEPPLFIKGTL